MGSMAPQRLRDSGRHGHACLLIRSQVRSRSPPMLKQSVLAHVYGCHKSILLLKAAYSHCSSHAGSRSAILQNRTQKFLAFPFNLYFAMGLLAMVMKTFLQQNLANTSCFPNRIFFVFCDQETNWFSIRILRLCKCIHFCIHIKYFQQTLDWAHNYLMQVWSCLLYQSLDHRDLSYGTKFPPEQRFII